MPYVTFDRIEWKQRYHPRGAAEAAPEWRGFDTETCRGDVRLLCDSEGRAFHDATLPQMLDALNGPWRGVFYNLRYDVECLLKGLPRASQVELYGEGDTSYDGWELSYVPRKMLTIRRGREKATRFYDAAQFFSSGLDAAAKCYLGRGKSGMTKAQVKRLGQSPSAWARVDRSRLERYCVEDARLCRDLMQKWEGWASAGGMSFSMPISPAFVTKSKALQHDYPEWTREDHASLGPIAWAAFGGGRFESRIKGYGKLWAADIRSAYPAEMVNLPDPRVAWRIVRREADALNAAWGFVQADVHVNTKAEWGPIPCRVRGVVAYPVGNLGRRWLTLDEWRAFGGVARFRFHKAVIAEDNGARPLAWLADAYHERAALKAAGEPREAALKVGLNSMYGVMLQRTPVRGSARWRDATPEDDLLKLSLSGHVREDDDGRVRVREVRRYQAGPLFHPVLAAHITARVRLRLWDVMHRVDVAAVATDGVFATEPFPRDVFGSELGDWSDEGARMGVVVGNGLYQRVGEKSKRRGFGEPLQGFAWLDALRAAPRGATTIRVEQERPLHPGELLRAINGIRKNGKRYTEADAGLFVREPRTINLNGDVKRTFPRVTARGLLRARYHGKPIRIDGRQAPPKRRGGD